MSLPSCSYNYPSCGSCYGDLRYEDTSFYCEECQLDYGDGDDETQATFIDPEAKPCGKPCSNYWHGDHKLGKGYGYECGKCELPEGHTSECWTQCTPIRLEES